MSDINNLIINDYMDGIGINKLRIKYNVSQQKIYEVLNKYNVSIRNKGGQSRYLSEKDIKGLVKKYKDQIPLKELEKEYKTSKERIKRILKELNVPVREISRAKVISKGRKFGKWTYIQDSDKRQNNRIVCEVICDRETVIKLVYKNDLLRGKTKSCGCDRKPTNFIEDRKEAMINNLYSEYRKGARNRGYSFNLGIELFEEILDSNCYYCGTSKSSARKDYYSEFIFEYMGIDRLKNDKGYESDNVVPCCTACNYMKRSQNEQEFLLLVEAIYKNRINSQE